MTLCVIDKGHCMCQPDEGVFCPNYKPDAYVQCLMDTITELLKTPQPEARAPLTDEQIMNAAIKAADALDATRVSELRAGRGGSVWHATTIFDGDAGLIRFGRLIEAACKPQSRLPSEDK